MLMSYVGRSVSSVVGFISCQSTNVLVVGLYLLALHRGC
jgi:hypothetical protein